MEFGISPPLELRNNGIQRTDGRQCYLAYLRSVRPQWPLPKLQDTLPAELCSTCCG